MKKLCVFLPVAALLSACGSSGGGNDKADAKPTTAATPTASSKPTAKPGGGTGNATVPSTTDANVGGTQIHKDQFTRGKISVDLPQGGKIVGENRRYSFNGALQDVDSLTVDGVNLALNATSGMIGGLYGVALKQAFWPVVSYADSSGHDVFYMGYETPANDMPKSGRAHYTGVATRYDPLKGTVRNAGTMSLTADFGNKTVNGHLRMDGLRRNISLETARIHGNSFAGTAVVGTDSIFVKNRTGRYEGKFYGPQAAEVAGKATFDGRTWGGLGEDLSNLNTSFGGTKQ